MALIAVPAPLWEEARAHLLGRGERFGFFLAGVEETSDGPRFCLKEFLPVADEDVDHDWEAERVVKLEAILRAINAAKKSSLALVEAHSHPGAGAWVRFSATDEEGLDDFSSYAIDALDGKPYGALVFGDESVDAVAFEEPGRPLRIRAVTIAGETLSVITPTSSRSRRQAPVPPQFDRNVRALGEDGQRRLGLLRAAIVGLGGLGSHVAQQLAYLGIRNFTLVDADLVDETSLNRLVGATPEDVGMAKVNVARQMVEAVAGPGKASVASIPADLRDPRAMRAIADCDLVFGCFDNDGARQVLNEIATALVLPYFDLASGIEAPEGRFEGAGGRIAFSTPGGPCLNCAEEIDRYEAGYFLSGAEAQQQARDLGYAHGWHLKAASVVSINAAIASIAVNEFLGFTTGLWTPNPLTYYYVREPGGSAQKIAQRRVARDANCLTCAQAGKGRLAGYNRYSPDAPEPTIGNRPIASPTGGEH